MAGKTLSFYNLTGGLNTIQDLFTLNSTPNRTETPEMYNVEYYKLGGLQSMRGNIPLGNKLDGGITCGFEYITNNKIYNLVTTTENKLYMYSYNTNEWVFLTNINSGTINITAERHSIVGFADGIVVTDGENFVYYKKDRKDLLGSGTFVQIDSQDTITFDGTTIVEWYINLLNSGSINTIGMDFDLVQQDLSLDTTLLHVQGITEEGTVITLDNLTALPENIVKSRLVFNSNTSGLFETDKNVEVYITQEIMHFSPTFRNVDTESQSLIQEIPIKGLALNAYKGRLWIGSKDGRLFYSSLGTFYDFNIANDAGAFENFEEDNSEITAIGRWSQYLVLHKRFGSYLLDGTDNYTSNWSIKPYSESSCNSQQSFINNDEGYYIYSNKHQGIIPLLSRSLYNTTYQGKEISVKIQNVFDELNTSALDKIFITYHPIKRYLLFYMPFNNGNGSSNKCYIYDLITKSWLLRIVPQNVTCAYQVNNKVYIGTAEGYILQEFLGDSFFIGYDSQGNQIEHPIEFSFLTPSYVWGGGTNKTTTKEFRIKLQNAYNNNFFIQSLRDGNKTSKSRNIKTSKDIGNILYWDIGLSKANINQDAEFKEIPIYKYQGTDDITYYCTEPNITATTLNVLMYKELNKDTDNYYTLTRLAGLNQNITYTIPGTSDDYTNIQYTEKKVYGWRERIISAKAYRNGSYVAWIQDGVPYALVNITEGTHTVYTYYGVKIRRWSSNTLNPSWAKFRLSPTLYERVISSQQQGSTEIFLPSSYDMFFEYNGAYVKSYERQQQSGYPYQNYQEGIGINQSTPIYNSSGRYTPGFSLAFQYGTASIQKDPYTSTPINNPNSASSYGIMYRNEQDDVSYQESYEVPNGEFNIRNTIQRLYTNGENDTVIVEINGQPITFNRYPSLDEGYYSETAVYTTKEHPSIGDEVYTNINTTTIYSTITSVLYDSILLANDKTLYRSTEQDTISNIPTYLKVIHTEFSREGDEPIGYMKEGYQFPDDENSNWNKTLTNTVWNENTWSSEKYITKRFLLPDQYFETIQYRFYGNTLDNSLCISGFEIDGIQLTEVPW